MKTKIILLSLLAVSPIAKSADVELCEQIQELAEVIMTARQDGAKLNDMMAASDNRLAHEIVIDAYKEARYNTPQFKLKAVNEFSNKWVLGCYEMDK